MTLVPARTRLVVSADRFGDDEAGSDAILAAHRDGIVTSTSVSGTCAEPAALRARLARAPRLGVGGQLVLSGAEPILDRSAIRSLVTPGGAFPPRAREVFLNWASGVLREDDVEREFDAQVRRLGEAGLDLDHLATRGHIGLLPTVGRAVENVARRHRIPGIRIAVERPTLAWAAELPRGVQAAALGALAWVTRRQMGPLRHGPQTWRSIERGGLDEILVLEILGRLGPGTHELVCHPAGAGELQALTSAVVKSAIARRGIQLCRWRDLF